jgi:hypothetical protein
MPDISRGKIAEEAQRIERDYGDLAPLYAETRAEAAEARGKPRRAGRWKAVEEAVEARLDDEASGASAIDADA